MAEITNQVRAKTQRLLFLKGMGYILTGGILIFSALVFSGMALDFLSRAPTVNPIIPSVFFFAILLAGLAWGTILIVRGYYMIPPKHQ